MPGQQSEQISATTYIILRTSDSILYDFVAVRVKPTPSTLGVDASMEEFGDFWNLSSISTQ